MKIISGKNFKDFAQWNLCNRYTINFDINKIQENDFIFLNLDNFEQFVNYLNLQKFDKKINLITHNSDREFNENMFNCIEKYINIIYPINSSVNNDKVIKIPLGFGDAALDIINTINIEEKQNLIYFNINLKNHNDRVSCFNWIKQFDWVTIENNNLTFNEFYNNLNKHKYSICPRGVGIDTHRIYESIYLNVIPIVKNNELSDMYKKIPIFAINDWNEINLEILNNKYEELYSNLISWKEKNKNWYKINYWIN
jgi:hypothetical protein